MPDLKIRIEFSEINEDERQYLLENEIVIDLSSEDYEKVVQKIFKLRPQHFLEAANFIFTKTVEGADK